MRDYTAFDRALQAGGIQFQCGESMALYTSFKIGGPAERFVAVPDMKTLTAVTAAAKAFDIPYMVLGNGSNLLVPDEGLHGAVLRLVGDFKAVGVEGTRLTAGAGASLSGVCSAARRAVLTGLEFAWGIPGSLGGAVYMNAGAYGGEMKRAVESVEVLEEDGTVRTVSDEALGFSYRKSAFSDTKRVILRATLLLEKGDEAAISSEMEELMRRRREKQPVELPSAGSVFKRPEGHFAGTLIEQCGLKGCAVGGAAVSEKHAGFIINLGGATCRDVEALIAHIQKTVLEKTGVTLEPEIRSVSL